MGVGVGVVRSILLCEVVFVGGIRREGCVCVFCRRERFVSTYRCSVARYVSGSVLAVGIGGRGIAGLGGASFGANGSSLTCFSVSETTVKALLSE